SAALTPRPTNKITPAPFNGGGPGWGCSSYFSAALTPRPQKNPPPPSMGAGWGGGAFLISTAAARHSPPDTCIAPTAMLFGGRPTEHRALSSAVEHYLDTVGVASSILTAPTIFNRKIILSIDSRCAIRAHCDP